MYKRAMSFEVDVNDTFASIVLSVLASTVTSVLGAVPSSDTASTASKFLLGSTTAISSLLSQLIPIRVAAARNKPIPYLPDFLIRVQFVYVEIAFKKSCLLNRFGFVIAVL